MSKKGKKIAIIAVIVILLVVAAVIAALYVNVLNAPINGTQNDSNIEQNSSNNDYDHGLQPSTSASNASSGNSNGSSNGNSNLNSGVNTNMNVDHGNNGETKNAGVDNTTSTTSEIHGSQRQIAESCVTDLYDSSKGDVSLDAFATDIPERYNNSQNSVVQFKRDGNTSSVQRICKYKDSHVISTEIVSVSGGYERYKIISEAVVYEVAPMDSSHSSVPFNVRITSDVVVDANGKIVYLSMLPERI